MGDRTVGRLIVPESVAVIGASARRETQGNRVIANLVRYGFGGKIIPVHPSAEIVDGWSAVPSIEALPESVDVAMVCTPASSTADVIRRLDRIGCNAAVVVAAGFTDTEDLELRSTIRQVDMAVNGPNCMGLINLTDSIPLYTAPFRDPCPRGNVSLIAQSGSAAIAIVNTPGLGFARVITSGNEYGLTSARYLSWLAEDDATEAVGLIIESIPNPDAFTESARRFQASGKGLVVLKVGRSNDGARATKAHTGALLSRYDAYESLFRRAGVATVRDYDELVAVLQCLSSRLEPAKGRRVAILGISGGQAGVACDVAEDVGIPLARFSSETVHRIQQALPGTPGTNPIDFGARVARTPAEQESVWQAVIDDPSVDSVLVLQDAQSSLPLSAEHLYLQQAALVVRASEWTQKPIVVASNTSADSHPLLREALGPSVPLLRGIREALVALRSLAAGGGCEAAAPGIPEDSPEGALPHGLREEIALVVGKRPGQPLGSELTQRILSAYGIPFVRSGFAQDVDQACEVASSLGFPVVIKVSSRDIPHRSMVGGVEVDVRDESGVRAAIDLISVRVRQYAPSAKIEGYEIQEALGDSLEAIVGFRRESPFTPLVMVGSGGIYAELFKDVASELAPMTREEARQLIGRTKLGERLSGYHGLTTETPRSGLAEVIHRVSVLAADLGTLISECDLNPVMIASATGRTVAVDALLVG